jgi:hypothetical protein
VRGAAACALPSLSCASGGKEDVYHSRAPSIEARFMIWELTVFRAVILLIGLILAFVASRGPRHLQLTLAIIIFGALLLWAISGELEPFLFLGTTIAVTTASMALVIVTLRRRGTGAIGQALVALLVGVATLALISMLTIRQ